MSDDSEPDGAAALVSGDPWWDDPIPNPFDPSAQGRMSLEDAIRWVMARGVATLGNLEAAARRVCDTLANGEVTAMGHANGKMAADVIPQGHWVDVRLLPADIGDLNRFPHLDLGEPLDGRLTFKLCLRDGDDWHEWRNVSVATVDVRQLWPFGNDEETVPATPVQEQPKAKVGGRPGGSGSFTKSDTELREKIVELVSTGAARSLRAAGYIVLWKAERQGGTDESVVKRLTRGLGAEIGNKRDRN